MQTHFPLVLDMADKACLVVGGGEVATRKAEALMHAQARVTVIAPEATAQIAEWAAEGLLDWRQEPFSTHELKKYTLVVAATNRTDVNLAVWQAVKEVDGWINIVDRPDLCNFIVPSTVQRGKLVIAISTSGASPGLARKIRQQVEQEIGPEYESYVDFLAAVRGQVMKTVSDTTQRKKIFRQLLDDRFLLADDEQRYQMAETLINQVLGEGLVRRQQ
ncbi:precorrin-2 dehydrogenase/sirohydrochlorin ferrochelatase family protein [Brevibacillus migulae]|uniref:precorrin-2 dehydrogenase/sirohydrochlorin ferrochelatase family protein n=1 Tax=Brevibacillus migulae TaxID=1644114 RepID=UPI00106E739D|nr:bifunctional precorrin-2 dehydrogenase/sirohydrochlorin ferrochelatase [Brevibacillus migulae]